MFVLCQDQIPPFPNRVAIQSIESQLGVPVSRIFADISPEPVAAASLGQVYKGNMIQACEGSKYRPPHHVHLFFRTPMAILLLSKSIFAHASPQLIESRPLDMY